MLDRVADVLDAAEHGRDLDELGVESLCHQARQRRLAHARRAPENHRVQPPGVEGRAQRLARRQQMALADHLVERAWAQPLGQRRVGRRHFLAGARRVIVVEQRSGHRGALSQPMR
jgi:hypothetical protein